MGVRVALDAFGGDDCPGPELDAAVVAARDGISVTLVGDEEMMRGEIARRLGGVDGGLDISFVHAPERIHMEDSPARAVRAKSDASMPVCFDLVKRGEADAVVSAGNSGAMLACGLFKSGRLKGVDRPAIVTAFPTRKGQCCMLDMGANAECRPLNLVQFALMGAAYATVRQGRVRPRVGLLSNGSEAGKGTPLTRTTHQVLEAASSEAFEYLGYVEGGDVFAGGVDVVVTDGFTGNVALKFVEGALGLVSHLLRDSFDARLVRKFGALLARPAFAELKDQLDPESYGGAPLLGVRDVVVICHGSSSPTALANGMRQASRFHHGHLTEAVEGILDTHGELSRVAKEAEQV